MVFEKIVKKHQGQEKSFGKLFLPDKIFSKILISVLAVLICSGFHLFKFYTEDDISTFAFQEGGIWPHRTLIAEYSFPIFKSKEQYLNDLQKARENVLPVFLENNNAYYIVLNKFDSLYKIVSEGNFSTDVVDDVLPNFQYKSGLAIFASEKQNEIQRAKQFVERQLFFFYLKGVIDLSLKNIKSQEVTFVSAVNNLEKIVPKRYLYDKEKLISELKFSLKPTYKDEVVAFFVELVNRSYVPSYTFSDELYQRKIQFAEKSVPKTIGYVKAGEVIVAKGRKLTSDDVLKLKSYEKVKLLKEGQSFTFTSMLGSILNILSIYSIIFIYLLILRKRIFGDFFQFGLINIAFILIGLLSWLSVIIQTDLQIKYLIILPSISLLIAIVFDSRTAFYSTITFALLIASIRGNDFETAVSLMLASIIGAYSVRDIQSRTQMFRSMVFVALGFVVPILAFYFQKASNVGSLFEQLSFAFLNSVLSPVISYGLLFIIEKISSITTDLKLKEYDDINHPLLQKLSEVAPGTYQHTLSMALLAESCAEAIGANRLLTRVGAYFHDIGKIFKPEYFVENQIEVENKHQYISPKRSAEIIREHVLKGIDLAKQYNLPPRIIDFIPMHHGTSLIKHFYAKAIEESDGTPIDEADFRYPGPKPNSKETVIVMICDSAEALSRLPFKSKEELNQSIEKMIMGKLMDGQFDESDISMKDLKVVQEVCLRQLFGILHPRVEYKEIPQNRVSHTNDKKE
ncbi:MAG: HDIG domain-containing protein [Ignavibacteria bacterium]|nr:HDIG domain-containing protein [Ignavibacteria bacterium]